MLKQVIFIIAIAVVSIFEVKKMKKRGLKREFFAYMLFTAAAVIAAVITFTGHKSVSVLGVLLKSAGV